MLPMLPQSYFPRGTACRSSRWACSGSTPWGTGDIPARSRTSPRGSRQARPPTPRNRVRHRTEARGRRPSRRRSAADTPSQRPFASRPPWCSRAIPNRSIIWASPSRAAGPAAASGCPTIRAGRTPDCGRRRFGRRGASGGRAGQHQQRQKADDAERRDGRNPAWAASPPLPHRRRVPARPSSQAAYRPRQSTEYGACSDSILFGS